MTQAINLEAALGGTERPNPEHVCIVNGQQWFEYEATYLDDETGRSFSFSFWALNFDDARRRIRCIHRSASVTGQIYGTYPDEGISDRLTQGAKRDA